jgi:molecular chaperone DnaK
MQQKSAALTQAAMKLGEAMYKAQQAETEAAAGADAGTSGPAEEQPAQEEVVDAEFSEVDEENKG